MLDKLNSFYNNIPKEDKTNTKKVIIYLAYFLHSNKKEIFTAKDSETQEEMVIYRRLYEDGGLWNRISSSNSCTIISSVNFIGKSNYRI